MVKVTFLIGNGFDLNLGLKTTYSHFWEEYKEVKKDDTEIIKWFKTEVLKDKELWSAAEEAFGECTSNFAKEKYNAEDFCECHENFCRELAKYLHLQENRVEYDKTTPELINRFKEGFENYFSGFRDAKKSEILKYVDSVSQGISYNFVSFNYTEVIDKLVEIIKKRPGVLSKRRVGHNVHENAMGQVLHVHGTIYDDMVLGVNDETQISDKSIFDGYGSEYMDQLIKFNSNQYNERYTDERVFNLLKESDVIYIYGMAIGKTDALWWKRICDLMISRKTLRIIIHKYNAPTDELIRRGFITYSKKCRQEIMSYCELAEEEKKEIESRIFIDRTNILSCIEGFAKEEIEDCEKDLSEEGSV